MDPANVKDKMTDKLKDGQIEKRGIGFDIKKPYLDKDCQKIGGCDVRVLLLVLPRPGEIGPGRHSQQA